MAEGDDYRLYLEQKFAGIHTDIHARDINVHDKLDAIKEQTTRTNSRVTHLEEQRDEYLKTRVSVDMFKECKDDLETIKEDMLEYHFFKKYPKIFVGLIVVLVIGMLAGFGLLSSQQRNLKTEVDMINTPIKTNRGIELMPSGVVMDSLYKN